MPEWLKLELAEELRPAAAPDELWERIGAATARPVPRRESPRQSWSLLPIAAIVTLTIAAATLWLVAKGQAPGLDLRQLAIEEVRNPLPLDLHSSDPAQVNGWVKRQAGVDLSLPAGSPVRLVGARVIRKGGARVGAVTYRIGSDTATLLVARAAASPGLGDHGSIASLAAGHPWTSRGQVYALACSNPERPEAACLLCHASL